MDKEVLELVQGVLKDGFVMSLGTYDDGGVWVADLIYLADENLNLYWISLPGARHSKAIELNKKVACTITVSHETDNERAAQIEGVAEKIEGPMFEFERRLEFKRGLPEPNSPGEILDKGHVWYRLSPTKIELIHSKPFGYEKQVIKLP